MKTALVVGMLATTAITASPVERPVSPVGVYACHGVNPNGTAYDFDLTVKAQGDAFVLMWMTHGTPQMVGLGLRDHDTLSVAFFGQDMVGVVVYHITAGRLTGVWTAGGGVRGGEVCQVGRDA